LSAAKRVNYIENRVLRNIFGSKLKKKIMGGWRKLRNEEVRNLYSSSDIIRMIRSKQMRWIGHVPRIGEKRNAYKIMMGKPQRGD
jgi:hypothetical protein